jgi:hypothetical protein
MFVSKTASSNGGIDIAQSLTVANGSFSVLNRSEYGVAIYFLNPGHWGMTLTIGDGVDYGTPFLHHHLSLRLSRWTTSMRTLTLARRSPRRVDAPT